MPTPPATRTDAATGPSATSPGHGVAPLPDDDSDLERYGPASDAPSHQDSLFEGIGKAITAPVRDEPAPEPDSAGKPTTPRR